MQSGIAITSANARETMDTVTNLRNEAPYRELSSFIKAKAEGRRICFVPSPGNWGDALINQGSVQFFEYYGIDHDSLSREELETILDKTPEALKNETVVVGGGGGWCDNWSSTPDFVRRISHGVADVIVLPSSFSLQFSAPANVYLFRRDNFESGKYAATSVFCHDMALFLELPRVQTGNELWKLQAFRTDIERHPDAVDHKPSIDISLLGDSSHQAQPFFEIVNRFEEIHTDRLHVAIAGAMLGKKVRLFPGNYSKSHDVWRSSLREHYPKVSFTPWE